MTDVKEFLYAWSGRRKLIPNYEVKSTGTKHRQQFLCECRLKGYDFVAVGTSTSKRDAMTIAAREMVQYLVRKNVVDASQVPGFISSPQAKEHEKSDCGDKPGSSGECSTGSLKRLHITQEVSNDIIKTVGYNKQLLQEAEEADFAADLHGGWTLENAKSRLHQFMQANKIKCDYKFSSTGPEHSRSYIAEMSFFLRQVGRVITGREHGSNKQNSSKLCALSIVRQLYHMELVEPFTGTKKSKKLELPPYGVELNQATVAEIADLLARYDIKPQEVVLGSASKEESISLLCNEAEYLIDSTLEGDGEVAAGETGRLGTQAGGPPRSGCRPNVEGGKVVDWWSPRANWNPWMSGNVDHKASMEDISKNLLKIREDKVKNNAYFKRTQEEIHKLPIFQMKEKILETVRNSSVVLIRGETGSGKTTQVPQYILDEFIESGRGAQCSIIITQPRRISAVSISERVSDERTENLGESAGYSVRFESVLPRAHGSLLYCTVGTLLRKLEGGLRGVSHVIVDEIHERDINTDFLLIILKDMVQLFPDLRVILMSASVDTVAVSKYFGDCPVVEVSGRVHPVKEFFLEDVVEMLHFVVPLPCDKKKDDDEDFLFNGDEKEDNCNLCVSNEYRQETRVAMARLSDREHNFELLEALIMHISSLEVDGAILIFLSGWNIIFSIYKHLQRNSVFGGPKYLLLPLHSQIPREDQRRVFHPAPPGVTKIILATNIAESSITINDVVFVIDFCKVKTKLFTLHNNMTNFTTVWCSRTNLEQRKGRAGRVQSGFCFYMCSRERYKRLEEYSCPEILRSPLHELCLSIKLLRLGPIGWFLSKALQPPPIDAVIEAEALLREMKALDKRSNLTALGRILARLPIEPRLGKMIIYASVFRCGDAVCTVAASTTFSEPFVVPSDKRRLDWVHKSLSGGRSSDHCALLNAFQSWNDARILGDMQEIHFCSQQSLNIQILRMANEAKNQLSNILLNAGFPDSCFKPSRYQFTGEDAKLDLLITLLGLGFYPNVCFHKDKRKVFTADNKPALVHKSSVNCSNREIAFSFPFFIFTEKIRTRAVACKQMTMVTPLQLLLFASRSVRYNGEAVVLDGWINLEMDPRVAAKIVALRPALENLITKATADPDSLERKDELDLRLIRLVQDLSSARVASFGFESRDGEPPSKRSYTEDSRRFPNQGFHSHRGGFPEDRCGDRHTFHPRGAAREGFNSFTSVRQVSSNPDFIPLEPTFETGMNRNLESHKDKTSILKPAPNSGGRYFSHAGSTHPDPQFRNQALNSIRYGRGSHSLDVVPQLRMPGPSSHGVRDPFPSSLAHQGLRMRGTRPQFGRGYPG